MPDTTNETADAAEAKRRALAPHVGDDELNDTQTALTAVHVPGTPLERTEDGKSSRAFEADQAKIDDAAPVVEPAEYLGINTLNPELNYASRSNIVKP